MEALFGQGAMDESHQESVRLDPAADDAEKTGLAGCSSTRALDDASEGYFVHEHGGEYGVGTIEFGSLDDQADEGPMRPFIDIGELVCRSADDPIAAGQSDPWRGPDVEFAFDASTDPFQEFFEQEERIVDRYSTRSPDELSLQHLVAGVDGAAHVRQLAESQESRPSAAADVGSYAVGPQSQPDASAAADEGGWSPAGHGIGAAAEIDDADMVVIEEDLLIHSGGRPAVAAVRLGDYRRLFARLRRGG
jgi:hypothetical protein